MSVALLSSEVPRVAAFPARAKGTYQRAATFINDSGIPTAIRFDVIVPGTYNSGVPMRGTLGVAGDGKFGSGGEQLTEGFGLWASNANTANTLTEIAICPEMPTAPNLFLPGTAAQAYLNCWDAACVEFNIDPTKRGYVGVSGGGRDGVAVVLRRSATWCSFVFIESALSEKMLDWALGTTGTTQAAAPGIMFGILGASGLKMPCYWGQKGDDATVLPQRGRQAAGGFGAPFTAPFTTPPTYTPPVTGVYEFDEVSGNCRYVEKATGGHSWDDVLNDATFETWRLAQHQ